MPADWVSLRRRIVSAGMLWPRPTEVVEEDTTPMLALIEEHNLAANRTMSVWIDVGIV